MPRSTKHSIVYSQSEPSFPYIPPRLVKGKRWYLVFSVFSTKKGGLVIRKTDYDINKINDESGREKEAAFRIKEITAQLHAGWHILEEDEIDGKAKQAEVMSAGLWASKIPELATHLRRNTRDRYSFAAQKLKAALVQSSLSNRPVAQLRKEDVALCWSVVRGWSLAGITKNNLKALWSAAWNRSHELGWVPAQNPFVGIRNVPQAQRSNYPLPPYWRDFMAQYLKAHHPQHYLFVKFMYHCFMRPGEVANLRRQDILESRKVRVPRGEGAYENKRRRDHYIPINDIFYDLLMGKIGHLSGEDYLFGAWGKNRPGNLKSYSKFWRKICLRVGCPTKHNLYAWKHTGVCDHYEATNGDIEEIMRLCGHASVNTTMVYLSSLGLHRPSNVSKQLNL